VKNFILKTHIIEILCINYEVAIMSQLQRNESDRRSVCVAGLSLTPEHAQLVVLAGDQAPQSVLCAEHLLMPEGLWREHELIDPQGLGQWIASYLQSRDLQPQSVSLSVDDCDLQWRTVTLPAELSNEDLAFQITAEMLAGRVQQADQICVDYQVLSAKAGWHDQHTQYRAVMIAAARIQQLRTVARSAHLSLHAIEPLAQSEERTRQFASFVQRSSVSAAGVLMCDQACGLALAHWDGDIAVNFHPLHLETAQRQQRHWVFRMMGGLAAGVVASAGLAMLLNWTTQIQRESLQEAYAVTRSLDEVRKINAELTQQTQRQQERDHVMQTRHALQSLSRDG
jgi:hypothetical protein